MTGVCRHHRATISVVPDFPACISNGNPGEKMLIQELSDSSGTNSIIGCLYRNSREQVLIDKFLGFFRKHPPAHLLAQGRVCQPSRGFLAVIDVSIFEGNPGQQSLVRQALDGGVSNKEILIF